jgi:Tfp pilus assembly protein FimV
MNCSAAILTQWRREDPDRLLQAALSQAERLAEMAPQAEALRAQNAWLHQQVEVKTKRIAELQAALEAAQRAAHRQAAPFRIEAQKRAAAPKRGRGASTDIRAPSGTTPSKSMSTLRSNSIRAHTVVARSSRISTRSSSSLKTFPRYAPTSHG